MSNNTLGQLCVLLCSPSQGIENIKRLCDQVELSVPVKFFPMRNLKFPNYNMVTVPCYMFCNQA